MWAQAARDGPVMSSPCLPAGGDGVPVRASTETERRALAAFPEIQHLLDLQAAGWSFIPVHDTEGELYQVNGVHTWAGGYADALAVRYTTDAAALRCDHTGGVVWQREGTLAEVVNGLLTLPAPGEPSAPRLVTASVPSLWSL
jgi:hypothetical protein